MSDQVEAMVQRVLSEDKLPLAAAARAFGGYGGGPGLHVSTLGRWILKGVAVAGGRRVKLDAVKFGSKFVTSRQAIVRFLAETTGAGPGGEVEAPRTPAARNKASMAAADELTRLGI